MITFSEGPYETGAGNCHTIYAPKRGGYQQIVAVCPTQDDKREYDSQQVFANACLLSASLEMYTELKLIEEDAYIMDRLAPAQRDTIRQIIQKAEKGLKL